MSNLISKIRKKVALKLPSYTLILTCHHIPGNINGLRNRMG